MDNKLAAEILEYEKKKLYTKSRGLALALGLLSVQTDLDKETKTTGTIGTDGFCLFLSSSWLEEVYRDNEPALELLFLHTLCHAMLAHPFLKQKDEEAEAQAWYLLCRILYPNRNEKGLQNAIREIREKGLFEMDDHSLWQQTGSEDAKRVSAENTGAGAGKRSSGAGESKKRSFGENRKQKELWGRALQMVRKSVGTSGRRGGSDISVVQSIHLTGAYRYDYRNYLMKFASLREEGGIDDDQFDYGLYTWSLDRYGTIPLIEPLEYREKEKVEELVIVIDTSGSCSEELVRMFLEETRNILNEQDLFFRRFRLRLLQCDHKIQRDDLITDMNSFGEYLADLHVKGGGGTDFRPAFERIEELRKEELYHLKGVLYFTDGYGIYPEYMPDYETAFVFIKYRYDDIDVPAWAQKLVLEAKRPRVLG